MQKWKRSRIEAINAGDQYYKTGKPCKYGHKSKRATSDGSCQECRAENQKEERAMIREIRLAKANG